MRKGSTPLGSLGVVSTGIVLLILPIYAVTVGALAPTPGWAAQELTVPSEAPPQEPDTQAVREALQRRSTWLDRVNTLASRKRATPRARQQARARILKVINTRATWYGPGFHGRRTASGERFNQYAMTMASRHLPFGTKVRVINVKNGKAAFARVNDRGPFRRGYTADLSKGLAFRIGMLGSGPVRLEILPRNAKTK